MTNQPGLIADSLIEFGQSGDYHTHSMTAAKESAGFAPLETLPAEWYNNYIYKLDAHINQLQLLLRQVQQELSNIITWDSTVTPDATVLNQVYNAIQRKIQAMLPVIATGATPGLVVSDATDGKVSVNASTGVMTVNGWNTWTSTQEQTISDAIDSMESEVSDAIDSMEATISGRAHVIAFNCVDNSSTSSAWLLTADSRIDGQSIASYTPSDGDMIVLNIPQTMVAGNPYTRNSVAITIGSSTFTYSATDAINLGLSNCFVITSTSLSTMVMTSGSKEGYTGPQYVHNIVVARGSATWGGQKITFTNYTPSIGDELTLYGYETDSVSADVTENTAWTELQWTYTVRGWVPMRAITYTQIVSLGPSATPQGYKYLGRLGAAPSYGAAVLADGTLYWGYFDEESTDNTAPGGRLVLRTMKDISSSNVSATFAGVDEQSMSGATMLPAVNSYCEIHKVTVAGKLNTNDSSTAALCYADASGNLHAHTLILT